MLKREAALKVAAALLVSALFTFDANAQCTGCFHPSFGPAVRAFGADFANSFVSGDFDRDGFPDFVIVAGNGSGFTGIGFMKGSGSGAFSAPVLYPSGISDSIVAADFDGDGLLDVATAGALLSIFLGNGDGSFQPPIEHSPDTYGSADISTADFNGDGVPDLAVNVFSLPRPRIYIGVGDGTFQEPSQLDVIFGVFLAAADFNTDGRPDVAVAAPDGVNVFLGDGHGGFSAPLVSAVGFTTFAIGDFNGDGVPDLAEDGFYDVRIELGNGDGTFADGQIIPTGNGPNAIDTGDFDLDGHTDLAVAVNQSVNIVVFHGVGDGTFGPGAVTPAAGQVSAILVGDFDASGRLDIAGLLVNHVIETLIADSTGAFPTATLYPTGGSSDVAQRLSLTIADLTGDGNADLAVTNLTTPNIGILPGDGAGHLGAPITVPTQGQPHWIATGSFDAGTSIDFAVASDAGMQVFLSNGDGTFLTLPAFGPPCQYAVAGDFNSDGKADLAVGSAVAIWLGNGDGTFTAGPPAPGVFGEFIEVGDFNNDLKPDLLVEGGSVINVLLGNGDGSFAQGASFFVEANAISRLAIGDFDGDGNLDFVGGRNPGDVTTSIYLYWGNGDGSFDVVTDLLEANYIGFAFRSADVNGDGVDDIVMGGAEVFTSNGDRTFERATWIPPLLFNFFTVGDLNADGKPDLAYQGGFPVLASVLLNTICEPSKLAMSVEPSSCDTSGVPFDTQPVLRVVDGGDNVMTCDVGSVTAAIRVGTGTAGAVLGGSATVATTGGVASFTDLSIDRAGRGYVIEFTHPLGMTHSWTITQDLTAVVSGPAAICSLGEGTYGIGGGYDRYQWFLDGAPISRAESLTLSGVAPGSHVVDVTAYEDGCLAADSVSIEVLASPAPPTIIAPLSVRVGETGILASATSGGNFYAWTLAGGTITSGQGTSQITFDAGLPGTTMVLRVIEASGEGCVAPEVTTLVQVDFADAGSGPFREDIDTVARHGITAGCGGGNFCPQDDVTRAQMAVFLLKAEHGAYYLPPPPFGGYYFEDVPAGSFAADWIMQLLSEGITAGCDVTHYCPDAPVTRAEMAVLLLKTLLGSGYVPPAPAGIFADVPADNFAIAWIEDLYNRGVTAGCGTNPLSYCPDAAVPREQMATFLVRTFLLP